ncbi:MAG: thioredoxin family protein [Kofleriaceae bacterium]
MRTLGIVTAAALALGGCKRRDHDQAAAKPAPGGGSAAAATTCAGDHRKGPLAWFEDDYAAALACAKASSRPLVVDLWAPWCHTCLSMASTVLVDPSLAPLADRYVWLGLDTDREANAAVVARFSLQNWPTYVVLDPRDESVAARWLGAASPGQFRQFLKDGDHAVVTAAAGGALDPAFAKLREGDLAAIKKDWAAADAAFGAALEAGGPSWPRRPDVLVAQISAKQKAGDVAGCLALGTAAATQTGDSANATDFLVWGLACADDDHADPAAAKALREQAVTVLSALADKTDAPLSVDDKSDLLMNLREALVALGRAAEATPIARRQQALLDQAAATAPSPAGHDLQLQRSEVYTFLPARARS